MVAIALIMVAGTTLFLKCSQSISKKQFESEMGCLEARLIVCHKLALAMQSDWECVFQKKGREWLFTAQCVQDKEKKLVPLHLHHVATSLGKQKKGPHLVTFFSNGQVTPNGTLSFTRKGMRKEWQLEQIH